LDAHRSTRPGVCRLARSRGGACAHHPSGATSSRRLAHRLGPPRMLRSGSPRSAVSGPSVEAPTDVDGRRQSLVMR